MLRLKEKKTTRDVPQHEDHNGRCHGERDHALGVVDEPEIQVHLPQPPNDAVEALERDLAVALALDVEVQVVGDGELAVSSGSTAEHSNSGRRTPFRREGGPHQ